MATRTAQVVIQVDDKSLIELNAEIKTLETSIKNLKIGTTEWVAQNQKLGTLKNRYQEVTEEAKKLQGQMTKITGSDQIRAIAKLGTGMVGAFAAANNGLALLTGNKAFDELTAKATTLMATMGGLNQIAELFSRQTMAGLASIGAGFKGLTSTVKGFSTATKAALISTGIGALIAGLGLVIANWDKIKGAIGGVKEAEKKRFDESQKEGRLIVEGLEAQNKVIEDQIKLLDERNKYKPNIIDEGLIAENTRLQNASLREQIKLKEELLNKNKDDVKSSEEALRKSKEWIAASTDKNSINDLKNIIKEARDNPTLQQQVTGIALLAKLMPDITGTVDMLINKRAKYNEEQLLTQKNINDLTQLEIENLKTQLKLNEEFLDKRTKIFEQQKVYIQSAKDLQALAENENIILNTRKDTEQQIFENSRSALYQQINAIKIIEKQSDKLNEIETETTGILHNQNLLTIEEQAQLDKLYAQIEALENQNELRIYNEKIVRKQLENDARDLANQKLINDELSDIELKYININEENTKRSGELESISNSLEGEVKTIEEFQKKYQDVLKFERQLNNTRKVTTNDIVENLKTELGYFITIQDKTREKFEADKQILENQIRINDAKVKEKEEIILVAGEQYKINQLEKERLELELSKVGSDPYLSRIEKQQKILDLQSQINKLDTDNKNIVTEITVANNDITNAKIENLNTSAEISGVEKDINKTVTDTQDKTVEITLEIQKQLKLYKRLQTFVGNYAEEIQAVTDLLSQSMELVATVFDSNAQRHQDEIDRLMVQYDEMNNAEADRQDRLLAYEEELKDANGDRYDELLSLIDQEKAAKDANFVSEVEQKNKLAELEHKKLLDERKAALWRKAQNIIEATIQGALAVIKALPNVFLSIAVGVLAAAGVATIAAQKVPDVPPQEKFEKGGFTKKGKNKDVAGIVHANEYVVPAKVMKTPSAEKHIAALESMRTRGYQDGGFVAPASASIPEFEYEKFIEGLTLAISKLPPNQVSLVAVSNGIREVEYTKQNAGLSR